MPNGVLNPLVRFLRQIAQADQVGDGDSQLLERFLRLRDEEAFAALVRRHGALVMGVCLRILGHQQDAEDAFQATFLVLARQARTIRKQTSAASWLYGVAYRLATKARAQASRRQFHEKQAPTMTASDPVQEIAWSDLRPVLDAEIDCLAERYRLPFILHYLEGRSNEEIARQLCCPVGTVGSRLARARQRLRDRLALRGLAVSAGAFTTFLAAEAASAAPSVAVLHSSIQAALAFAAGKTTALVGTAAFILAKGALRTMFLTKFSVGVLITLALATLGGSTALVVYQQQSQAGNLPAGQRAERADSLYRPAAYQDGVLLFIGTEIQNGEDVPKDLLIQAKLGGEQKTFRRLRVGDVVKPGQLLGMLDCRIAFDDFMIHGHLVSMAELDKNASEKIREEAYQTFLIAKRLATAAKENEELLRAEMTYQRYVFEALSKAEGVKKAKAELQKTRTALEMHEIRSSVHGKIKTLLKRPGEGVKGLEAIMEIEVLD